MPRADYLLASDDGLIAQCEVDRYRASGPGGQHRNKTESAVRLRHRLTGVTAIGEDSRSQAENRLLALGRLLDLLESRAARSRQARLAATAKARRQKAGRSRRTKAQVVEGKRRRGEVKRLRSKIEPDA